MDNDTKKEICDKYALTIKEAANYFNIGENKIRELIKQPECDFALFVGNRTLIKKKLMENYLDNIKYI